MRLGMSAETRTDGRASSETPILDGLHSPADLRVLGRADLDLLCAELRVVVINSVAANGGHLGPNLGVVELTVALHRVFSSPSDVIVWDTGHQCYPHKLLTGRRESFRRLRQPGGATGYPSRRESQHDWVENSHASTALPYAFGMGVAVGRTRTSRRVVAVVGDGSLTGGMAFEGLNNIGHHGVPVVVVLNDNQRSYAPTASPLFDGTGDHVSQLCRALGISYLGPCDGHDVLAVEALLAEARESDRPVLVHVLTEKGHGYAPALNDEEKRLHDTGTFDPLVGPGPQGAQGYTAVFSDALLQLAAEDDRIVAITAAMPGSTGLLPFQERFPDRFFDVGIAEQHAVAAAAGMAMLGLRPVVAVYSTFLSRAFDQANLDVGLHNCGVVFVIDRAGITGPDGPSHHGVLDFALMLRIPSVVILAPSSDGELRAMLSHALTMECPVAIRFPKGAAAPSEPGFVGEALRARRVRAGNDVCLVGIGCMLAAAERAAEELSEHGIDCAVWDPRSVRPVDEDLVDDALRCGVVVTVEDGVADGGAGAFICREIETAAKVLGRHVEVLNLGIPNEYVPLGDRAKIHAALNLDGHGVALTTASLLNPALLPS